MPPTQSSADAELLASIDRLAEKFAVAKVAEGWGEMAGRIGGQALDLGGKALDGVKDYGGQAFDAAKDYASQGQGQAGLLGAGIGALGGGLLGGASGLMGPRDASGKKRTLSSALTGALAGAGVGGGLGMAGHYANEQGLMPDLSQPPAAPAAPETPTPPAAPQPLPKWEGGTFSKALPYVAGADLGNQAIGTIAEKATRGSSVNPRHLAAGAQRLTAPGAQYDPAGLAMKSPGLSEDLARVAQMPTSSPKLRELLHLAQQYRGKASEGIIPAQFLPGNKAMTWGHLQEMAHAGSGAIRGGNMQDIANLANKYTGKPWTGGGTGYTANPLTGELAKEVAPPAAPAASRAGGALQDAKRLGPAAKRVLGNQPFSARSPGWKGNALRRLGPRALLYGGLPLLEMYGTDANPAESLKGLLY